MPAQRPLQTPIPPLNRRCRSLQLLAVLEHCLRRYAYYSSDLETQ